MTLAEGSRRIWSQFVASGTYEDDPGFREVVFGLSRRGMLVTGVLTMVVVVANMVMYVAVGNRIAVAPDDPETSIFLWDRLAIFLLGVVYLGLGLTRSGPRWARLIGAIFVLAAGVSILIDDIVQGGQTYYSDRYLAVAMLLVIALLPYRPRQALFYVVVIWGLYLASYRYLPDLLGVEGRPLSPGVLVFILIVAVFCIGLSAILYNSRYEQYRARRTAEQLRDQIGEQTTKLLEMEELKSRFFTNISHEFRTPLTLILGPVEDALNQKYGNVSEGLRQQLHVVRRSGHRLVQLINQLLDLSKLEAGRMTLQAGPGDLVQFVREIVGEFSSLAERNSIDFQFETESDRLPSTFDHDKVEKVVVNLLSNAFKFTPAGGTIRVSLRRSIEGSSEFAEISVRDSGSGIPAEDLPYIFDRFHQVGQVKAGESAGTGIGLALAKELIDLHRGQISVESEPGFGSNFVVRIPLDLAPSDSPESREEVSEPTAHLAQAFTEASPALSKVEELPENTAAEERTITPEAPTILVVDDNEDVRSYLKSHLVPSYQVVEAADGRSGLETAHKSGPDLIISDVMMPIMDGIALCASVKSNEKLNHIPVVLLTARADEASRLEGLSTGADDYLTKPFNADELMVRVENLIEIRRLLKQRFSDQIMVGPSEIAVSSAEAEFVRNVRDAVEEHLSDDQFGVDWLADEIGMSARNLQRRLKDATSLSPGGYIRMMRLERAKQLLSQEAGTVSEIAFKVGFRDADHFSRLFKQTVGVPPSEYVENRT